MFVRLCCADGALGIIGICGIICNGGKTDSLDGLPLLITLFRHITMIS